MSVTITEHKNTEELFYSFYDFQRMSPVFGIGLKLIIGETKKRHILEQRYTVESYARRKKEHVLFTCSIENRFPRLQFDRLLTFKN